MTTRWPWTTSTPGRGGRDLRFSRSQRRRQNHHASHAPRSHRPTEGTATVCGLDPERKALEVKKIVGYLPENVGFYGDMDAVQSLRYIAELNRIPGSEAEDRITRS